MCSLFAFWYDTLSIVNRVERKQGVVAVQLDEPRQAGFRFVKHSPAGEHAARHNLLECFRLRFEAMGPIRCQSYRGGS